MLLVFDRGVFELAGATESKWNSSVTVTAVILAPISLAKRTPCSTAWSASSDRQSGSGYSYDKSGFHSIWCFFHPHQLNVSRR